MVSGLDLMPTLLAAAGGTDELYQDCDGVNILPLAMGQKKTVRDTLHWDGGWQWAVRQGKWKLKTIVDEKRAAQSKSWEQPLFISSGEDKSASRSKHRQCLLTETPAQNIAL